MMHSQHTGAQTELYGSKTIRATVAIATKYKNYIILYFLLLLT